MIGRAVITIIVEQNVVEPTEDDYTVEDVAKEIKDAILRLNYDLDYFNVIDQTPDLHHWLKEEKNVPRI
ncbi:hypothetical protein LCGC14_0593430 [marine sediment metagenome]|uniref:Uncharacterized protein n=1 Tax=marine sediment metagenome TaxID=412755 RepID=A0A0F9RCW2_9ZZZZ